MATTYALYSTRDNIVFYVGQTNRTVLQRLQNHLSAACDCGKSGVVNDRIRAERAAGYDVKAKILKVNATWNEDEKAEIARRRAAGEQLVNVNGGRSCRNPEEMRAKLSATMKGREQSGSANYWDRVLGEAPAHRGNRAAGRLLYDYITTGEYCLTKRSRHRFQPKQTKA
jgi:hypothetical protein